MIPLVRTLSGVSDEPEPISPRTADSVIGAQAARLADATNDARASELRLLIEQSETASRPLPPGSDTRLLAAHERDLASRSEAATKARAELEEIERASRETAAEAARAVAKAVTAVRPLTKEEQEAWLAKHPYQPVPRAPFALSRFSSHDPELFDAAEEAVVAYLEERVMEQLSDQGVPEDAVGLDDVKYVRMMAKFREERRAQVEDLGEEEKRRYELERAAILNHIAATSRAIMAGYKTPAEAEAGGFSVTKTLFATPGAAVTGGVHRRRRAEGDGGGKSEGLARLRRRQRGDAKRSERQSLHGRHRIHEPERHQHTGNLKSRGHETRRRNTSLDDETRDETTNTLRSYLHLRATSTGDPRAYRSLSRRRLCGRLVANVSSATCRLPFPGFARPRTRRRRSSRRRES